MARSFTEREKENIKKNEDKDKRVGKRYLWRGHI